MKPLAALGLVVLCLIALLPVSAQEVPEGCDVSAALDAVQALIDGAPADADGLLAVLAEAADLLAAERATCAGLSYEGEGGRVLGPVSFEAGMYRAVAETTGYIIADIEIIEGACEAGLMGLFNEQPNDSGRHEALIQSEGCIVVIEVSNARQPWTLTFEKLG